MGITGKVAKGVGKAGAKAGSGITSLFRRRYRIILFAIIIIIFIGNSAIQAYEEKDPSIAVESISSHLLMVDQKIVDQVDTLKQKKKKMGEIGEKMEWYHYIAPSLIIFASLMMFYYYFVVIHGARKAIGGLDTSPLFSFAIMLFIISFLLSIALVMQNNNAQKTTDWSKMETWKKITPLRGAWHLAKNYHVFKPGLKKADYITKEIQEQNQTNKGENNKNKGLKIEI